MGAIELTNPGAQAREAKNLRARSTPRHARRWRKRFAYPVLCARQPANLGRGRPGVQDESVLWILSSCGWTLAFGVCTDRRWAAAVPVATRHAVGGDREAALVGERWAGGDARPGIGLARLWAVARATQQAAATIAVRPGADNDLRFTTAAGHCGEAADEIQRLFLTDRKSTGGDCA